MHSSLLSLQSACDTDEEDSFMGDNFMDVCGSLDEGEACDVTAVDRFHGLRVAHPPASLKIRDGITIGSDPSSGVVLKHAAVSLLKALCPN